MMTTADIAIMEEVNTKDNLIQFMVGNKIWEIDNFYRYALEMNVDDKMVTSRFGKEKEEGTFSIHIILQKDISNNEENEYDDISWIPFISGELKDIHSIITEETYNQLLNKIVEIANNVDTWMKKEEYKI